MIADGSNIQLCNLQQPGNGNSGTLHALKINGMGSPNVIVSPDGQTIAVSTDQELALWNWKGQRLQTLSLNNLNSIAFSPKGETIAVFTVQEIALWNWKGQRLQTLSSNNLGSVAFSPKGETIAVWNYLGNLNLWSSTLKWLKTINGYFEQIDFSPDGTTLITIDKPGAANKQASDVPGIIQIRSLTGQIVKTLGNLNPDWSGLIAFDPEGKTIASIDFMEPQIQQWKVDGTLLRNLKPTVPGEIRTGNVFGESIIWSTKAAVSWWHFNSSTVHVKDNLGRRPEFQVISDQLLVLIRPNANNLDTVELWNLKQGQLQHQFKLDNNSKIVPGSDEKRILTTGANGLFELRDLDGKVVRSFKANHPISAVEFSPDGRTLATVETDGALRLWALDS